MKIRPLPWMRSSDADNSHPSNYVNRRPRSFCYRRWIPDADAVESELHAVTAGTGGKAYRAEVAAAHNAGVATCDAALPSPP